MSVDPYISISTSFRVANGTKVNLGSINDAHTFLLAIFLRRAYDTDLSALEFWKQYGATVELVFKQSDLFKTPDTFDHLKERDTDLGELLSNGTEEVRSYLNMPIMDAQDAALIYLDLNYNQRVVDDVEIIKQERSVCEINPKISKNMGIMKQILKVMGVDRDRSFIPYELFPSELPSRSRYGNGFERFYNSIITDKVLAFKDDLKNWMRYLIPQINLKDLGNSITFNEMVNVFYPVKLGIGEEIINEINRRKDTKAIVK